MSEWTPQAPPSPTLPEEQAPAASAPVGQPAPAEPRLRLWPAVVLLILQWLLILIPGWVAPVTRAHFFGWVLGPIIGAAALAVWWLFASRLPWADRGLGLLAFVAGGVGAWFLCHSSIGPMGLVLYALPAATTAWVVWLAATTFLPWSVRRTGLVVVLLLAWGCFTLVRNEGPDGSMSATFTFRWRPTTEEQFLAELAAGKLRVAPAADASASAPAVLQAGDWPGFRGPDRDGHRTGVRIAADWKAYPPRLVWRHRVGPGWSSFAVVGSRLYTQEQRGEDEVVVCYDASSGAEVWLHRDAARFSETMAGPGPRATPTFHEGRIYAQGATGLLNCLDAATGRLVWSRDVTADTGAKVPMWGFASSPLVLQGVVSVFVGGPDGKSVIGYNAASGEPAWTAGEGQFSYCSPHPARLGGAEQVVIATNLGLTAFHPTSGAILWRHDWPLEKEMARIVQPTLLGESGVLLGTGFGLGTQRIEVRREGEAWATEAKWTTRAIKPYFNDLVAHQGHVYGFDNNFLTCVSLEDGTAKWRARGYGNGQVLLLRDQDLLLALSEKGEAALVEAVPDGHRERGRFQAIEGKTWNHPVVAHGKLFVRNGEEAACYDVAEGR
jgi:outer membrane protein assembly factor BamB